MVVGDVEIVPLVDATGELGELAELFPETTDWTPYRDAYPELFNGSRWLLPCACYLLRSERATVLVDTGVGPAGLWEWDAVSEEGLLDELARVDVPPEAVGLVFLTHLHVDHVGWNTDRDGRLVFPSARYVVHRDPLAFARESKRPHDQEVLVVCGHYPNGGIGRVVRRADQVLWTAA